MHLSNKSEDTNMDALEPKKLALIRILQILKTHSDFNHPLTQEDISHYLENDYGIFIERKAISRNISLLREAGYEIESTRAGSYLDSRDLEDSELRMLIDGVLSSKYITAKHSKDLIDKLCNMSNKYFRSHVKNVYSINDWSKTDNKDLFMLLKESDYDFLLYAKYGDRVYDPDQVFMKRVRNGFERQIFAYFL